MGTKMRHFEKDDHLRMNEDQSRFWRGGGTKSVTVGDTQLKMVSTRLKKNNLGCLGSEKERELINGFEAPQKSQPRPMGNYVDVGSKEGQPNWKLRKKSLGNSAGSLGSNWTRD